MTVAGSVVAGDPFQFGEDLLERGGRALDGNPEPFQLPELLTGHRSSSGLKIGSPQ